MARRRQNLSVVFVDSSVLFAAVCSPTGGSAKLFVLTELKLISSTLVLTEVERNVRNKLQSYHLIRFFALANKLDISKTRIEKKSVLRAKRVIAEKDAAILVDAKVAKSDYLVTLDRKDFFQPKVFTYMKPAKVVTPGELITTLSLKTPADVVG